MKNRETETQKTFAPDENKLISAEELHRIKECKGEKPYKKTAAVYRRLTDDAAVLKTYDYVANPIAEKLTDRQWMEKIRKHAV
jgi:hypothetical protein